MSLSEFPLYIHLAYSGTVSSSVWKSCCWNERRSQITPSLTPISTQAGCNTFRNISVLILLHNGQSQVPPPRGFRNPALQPRKKLPVLCAARTGNLQTWADTLFPKYQQRFKRIKVFCFGFQFKIVSRMVISRVYSEVESGRRSWVGWVAVCQRRTLLLHRVVILPQSNPIQSNQMKVILCQYISKVLQDYKYSCGYKINTKAKWKMANLPLFLLWQDTEQGNHFYGNRVDKMGQSWH